MADTALNTTIEAYLSHLSVHKRLAPLTVTRYAVGLRHLCGIGDEPAACTYVQLRSLLSRLHAGGAHPKTLANTVSAWRGYFAWCMTQGAIATNPALGLKTPKAKQGLPKALMPDATAALFANAAAVTRGAASSDAAHHKTSAFETARALAIMELLYGAGLRSAELLSLNIAARDQGAVSESFIHWSAKQVTVTGKGSKVRSVPLGDYALVAVKTWLEVRAEYIAAAYKNSKAELQNTSEPALFIGKRGARLTGTELRRIVAAFAKTAGAQQHLHPHMLRHSYASHLLQSSGDLRAVQELLGHASIAATQIYTRLDFQHLTKVYDQAHPRARGAHGLPPVPQASPNE